MMDDQDLTRQLKGLVVHDWEVPAGGAGAAVRTGRRRLVTKAVGAAALVGAVAVGVPVGLAMGETAAAPPVQVATQDAEPVVESSTPVEASTAPPQVPSPEPDQPTTTPEPSTPDPVPSPEPPAPVQLDVTATAQGPATAGELADLDVAAVLSDYGWEGGGGEADWSLPWCTPEPGADVVATGDGRTGWASQEVWGGDSGARLSVASYPDEAAAAQGLERMAARLAGCLAGPLDYGTTPSSSSWRELSRADAAITGTTRIYAELSADETAYLDQRQPDEAYPLRPGAVVVAQREGRFVALAVMVDEYALGNSLAELEGDTRPGAGLQADWWDAQAELDDTLARGDETAARLLDAAATRAEQS
jgi:hypothetical protein